MNRFLKHLALGTAAVCALAVPTLAADFTHCADALNTMGLFQGGTNGYDLDRAPTRLEAGVMLVRLLGAEETAKANQTYTAPFTDVADWAKPYVQYLYDNGLGNGVGNGKFGSDSLCTAQQYTTFLLRALGYSDAEGGDFTYATAMDYARQLGLVDILNCDESNFLRDDLAAMSYTALATKPKTGEEDLLTKLIAEGAIDKDSAQYCLSMFSTYRSYIADMAKANANTQTMSADATVDLEMQLNDVNFMTSKIDMTMAVEANQAQLDQTKLAYDMTINMQIDPAMAAAMGLPEDQASMTQDMEAWYTGGYYYVKTGTDKMKMALSLEDALAQMPTTDLTATTTQVEPLCAFTSITKAQEADGTTVGYNIRYAPAALTGMMDNILNSMTGSITDVPDMAFDAVGAYITFKNGQLDNMAMSMGMTANVEGQSMKFMIDLSLKNIQTGDAVQVTLPSDLNTYPEITAEDMGMVTQ
ncbi:hypothetical protein ACTQ33_11540 [Candidatus Avoscillospira sp. LCP25S3_F1]|uniref:hypothetical protein n=1 Tax=Candidatus Avoscillospira sp. LCP25S3_F1 TaxID=3438825 RepID=UPI003F92A03C